DSSDNIYITGVTNSFGMGDYNMCLVKFDPSGVLQWNRMWGGSGYESGSAIALDSSENIYITGFIKNINPINFDICLVKYDPSGVLQWNRTWDGDVIEWSNAIVLDSSDNIYITGLTNSFETEDYDMCLVKYDPSGVLQWNRTWGGSGYEYGSAIALDSSDNIYITGVTNSFGMGDYDMCLVKYDPSGVLQWNRTWGGSDNEYGFAIALDSSENIYIAGETESYGAGGDDIYLVKLVEKPPEMIIVGYELIPLTSVIFIITVILIKKRIKS
ncbi:MAG: SBBP repeat-containing protein, partial [Promethearchaeota archaeon]